MQGITRLFSKTYVVLLPLFVTLFCFSAKAQPPTQQQMQQIQEMLPPGVDPTKMSPQDFKSYFRDQNQKKQSAAGEDINATNKKNKEDEESALDKDSTENDDVKRRAYKKEETYGENIFQKTARYNVGELSTPPLDYPIGVGDHIIVALWGGGEYQEDYTVAKDGSIFPAHLGKITVQGLTFESARSLIYARFRSVVPASTNIQVTLGQPRSINVNVGGEVMNPGPVTVSAFSNAFNVIGLAGGVTEYGNLREIQIKRNGKVIDVVDVYKYLTSGEIGKHIYLQNNDFVLVNFYDKKVLATGQFRRPMYYQLKKNEGVKALIQFSGGFTSDAFTSGLKVISTTDEKQVIHDVNATAIIKLNDQDYPLADGDIIKANLINPGVVNKVELTGAVTYPGLYEIRQGDRLFDVINRAGGITKNTYLQRAYIFRGAGDSTILKSDKLQIDLTDYNKSNSTASVNNVLLEPNDVIHFFTISEFGEEQFVQIYGEIKKPLPDRHRLYGGMTLQDLIYLAGGLKQSAEYGRLEISSIVDIDSAQKGLKPTRNIVKSYAILPNLDIDSAAQNVLLKPYDQVFVRKNPTFELQQNVQLLGLVRYPGYYPQVNKNEKISSFIERAGGLRENANIEGAVLYRNKVDLLREKIVSKPKFDSLGRPIIDSALASLEEPVSIDLVKALEHKNSKYDIILHEGDIVYVPEINPFVTIKGRVQSPLRIVFDKEHTNLGFYIDKAGGYGIRPWRKRIFVTYANGKSRRTKNFFFAHFYPKIEEGSTITVPERPEGKEYTDAVVQTLTAIIPIIAATIIAKNL